jgi:hypothetical protein
MSPAPRRPAGASIYHTRGRRRFRLVFLLAGICAVTVLAAAGAFALGGGGDEVDVAAAPGASASATPSADRSAKPSPRPSPTSPSPSSAEAVSPDTVIEIGWVGDTTPGSKYGNPPDNGRALFAHVRDELSAPDLMIANLEGTYCDDGPSKCDGSDSSLCFAFRAPPSFAKALPWAGIDLVSLANNHSHDYLESGLEQTKEALDKNGVEYAGLPGQITYVDVKGVTVAVLAFSPYSWNQSLLDIAAAKELVREADREADVVIVLIHAGAEGSDKMHTPTGTEYAFGENRGDSRGFAHGVVDAGADLVLGAGPHVIRGIERYEDRLIAYSLGNFGGWGNFGISGNLNLSGLLTVKIDGSGRIRGGRWLSLRLAEPGVPVVDSSHTAAHVARQLSDADFAKSYRISSDGTITPP